MGGFGGVDEGRLDVLAGGMGGEVEGCFPLWGKIDKVPRPVPAHRPDASVCGVCGGGIVGLARARVALIPKRHSGMVVCLIELAVSRQTPFPLFPFPLISAKNTHTQWLLHDGSFVCPMHSGNAGFFLPPSNLPSHLDGRRAPSLSLIKAAHDHDRDHHHHDYTTQSRCNFICMSRVCMRRVQGPAGIFM